MADILGMIGGKDLLAFSQNYGIVRPFKGAKLFPDVKTQNIEAEYFTLSNGNALPTVAMVHALDSEARIGSRPALTHVNIEKLLIKEKLNQSEAITMRMNTGVAKTDLVKYVYNDLNTLGNAVVARAELAKAQVLSTGALAVAENGLNFSIDYGVPGANKVTADWGDPDHDILGDIQIWVGIASGNGAVINRATTSSKIMRYMQKNKGVQAAIYGTNGIGAFASNSMISALCEAMFGFSIEVDDEMYATKSVASGVETRTTTRFFPENKIAFYTVNAQGAVGTGLWGVTPEELELGEYTKASDKQFVTFTQWKSADPVAVWSKASGLFIPVLPNPAGLVIATITFDGEARLDSLAVTSSAGTDVGDTAISVSPALTSGNSYRYRVATDAKLPAYGQDLRMWTAWDGSADITAATGKEICVAEVDVNYRAVKAGIATVTAKAAG